MTLFHRPGWALLLVVLINTFFNVLASKLPSINHEQAWKARRDKSDTPRNDYRNQSFIVIKSNSSDLYNEEGSKWIPNEMDLRKFNFVTSVDDQGECGACWAFAVTGAIEVWRAKTDGLFDKLSAQQLLDCSKEEDNCEGGSIINAMRYAVANGLQSAQDYPYVEEKQTCKYEYDKVVYRPQNFAVERFITEWDMAHVVARRVPIIANIVTLRSFEHYRSGVYSTGKCLQRGLVPNHSVLIVGYGEDAVIGKNYWLIKNSMGPRWGEQGFIRFRRGIGLCRIGCEVMWPQE